MDAGGVAFVVEDVMACPRVVKGWRSRAAEVLEEERLELYRSTKVRLTADQRSRLVKVRAPRGNDHMQVVVVADMAGLARSTARKAPEERRAAHRRAREVLRDEEHDRRVRSGDRAGHRAKRSFLNDEQYAERRRGYEHSQRAAVLKVERPDEYRRRRARDTERQRALYETPEGRAIVLERCADYRERRKLDADRAQAARDYAREYYHRCRKTRLARVHRAALRSAARRRGKPW